MTKPIDEAKRIVGAVAGVKAAYSVLVKVTGQPIRDKSKPAGITVAGLPVFDRDENGKQHLFHWFRIRDVRK